MSAKYKKREGEKKYINEMKWIRKVLTFFFLSFPKAFIQSENQNDLNL